eukprot:250757-Chlamydomonas_euryale.AAC.6
MGWAATRMQACMRTHVSTGCRAESPPSIFVRPPIPVPRLMHPPMACSMVGSASSMCASSTTDMPVVSRYNATNSDSIALDSARREPWSTITTPTASDASPPAAAAATAAATAACWLRGALLPATRSPPQ